MSKELLTLRKRIKRKKPDFIRQDSHKRKEVSPEWRKPRGLHSKIRHRFAGHRAMPDPGYGSPAAVRGLHPSGLTPVVVHTAEMLDALNPKTQGAVLGRTLGNRTKTALLARAQELNITVLNVKDIAQKLKEISDGIAARKDARAKRATKKAAEEKAKEKPADKKTETERTDEEKKQETKKELDKTLTRRTK